jgi:F0F1-type ATP synthase membrane subunit b/b'
VLLAGRKAWAAITGMLDARSARIAAELDEASACAPRRNP